MVWNIDSINGIELNDIVLSWDKPEQPVRFYLIYENGKLLARCFHNVFVKEKHHNIQKTTFSVVGYNNLLENGPETSVILT